MRSIRLLFLFLPIINLAVNSFAQPAAKTLKPSRAAAPKPKLTEQQKRGLALLGQAETEAMALQPDMRAYIEWQASMGYQKYDLKKSNTLLENAFTATSELTSTTPGNCWTQHDEACRVKHWLQDKILEEMEKSSPDRALELSAGLERSMQIAVETRLLGYYLQEKRLAKAKDMLDRMARADGYPYAGAADLMQAIPKSQASERTAIFAQALANYRQVNTVLWADEGDFAAMLLRCWRDLPPEMALDAMDAIFEKAKLDAEDNKQPLNIHTWHHGAITFGSTYQLRVFELLPLLRELDSARADALIREEISLHNLVKKYPDGMFSIEPDFATNQPYVRGSHREILDIEPGADDDSDNYTRDYARMQDAIEHQPNDALAMALAMPETSHQGFFHPRLGSLMQVARGTAKKNPDVCRSALGNVRKLVGNDAPPEVTNLMLQAADLYKQVGDLDNAKSMLKLASHSIEEAYKKDADLGDPNKAFKGNWPSTQLWGKCLHLSARIAPELQDSILAEISDPEIQTFLRVMIANGLLGAERSEVIAAEMHNDGKRHYLMMR